MQSENPMTVLIVEDDRLYSELMVEVLQDADFNTKTASTMAEALWMAANNHLAAITLDLKLPDAVGTSALVQMRGFCPKVPILVISGWMNEHDFATLIAAGADACMRKPPDVNKLVAEVCRVIRLRSERGTLEELYRCQALLECC